MSCSQSQNNTIWNLKQIRISFGASSYRILVLVFKMKVKSRSSILLLFYVLQVWDTIMPQWMEAIKADVPPDDLGRFKVLLT